MAMKNYSLRMPQKVYAGEGALENVKIAATGARKAALFTDRGLAAAGLIDGTLKLLGEAGVETSVIDNLAIEPTVDQAAESVAAFRAVKADLIVAVGGGSVMDAAKLASVLDTDAYGIRDLLSNPALAKKTVPTLMIPTTAGTGAEATPNAIVTVPEKKLKVGIVNDQMIADMVILEAEMIRRLPRPVAASTGIDALAHAIECYTSNKATPFSDLFAMRAMQLIFPHIEAACDPLKEDMEAKRAMLLASFFGGVAITAAGTTAVHALSYPLGGKYHIAHGVSNAILLAPVMKFNEPACREELARVYDGINPQRPLPAEEKSAWVVNRLGSLVKNLDIPTDLSRFGVTASDLEDLVSAGMEVTRLLVNNKRAVTPGDAREIYRQILPR